MTNKKTDSAGKAFFERVRKGEHTLTISHSNYQEKTETITVDENHNIFDVSLIRKILDMLRIIVHDPDDNPVVSATVKLDDVTRQTGSVGGCTFRDVTVGDHELMISADGYNTFTTLYTVSEEQSEVTFKLTRVDTKKYDVHITVNDNENNPIVNATVDMDGVRGVTDNTGNCVLSNIPEGEHNLQISHTTYQTKSETVLVDETHVNFTYSLNRKTTTVNIIVTGENVPVSGASVTMNNVTSTTGNDGICSFPDIEYGSYEVSVVKTDYQDYTGEITVDETTSDFPVRLTALPKYEVIVGVHDNEHNPVQNATVSIDGVTRTTDSVGSCVFNNVTEGEHSLQVSHDYYQTVTETITVDSTHIEFTKSLTRMVASSVVITVNGDNNLPISDVTVQLNNIYRNTGVNGTCSFPNIPYGVHEILAVKDDYKEYTGEITVKDNQHNFTIRLTPVPRYTVGFMVMEPSSGIMVKAIENASVVLDGNTEQTTDSRGMCSFSNIMEGDHHISVTHDDYQTYTNNITVDENNTGFTVELTPFPS